MRLMGVAWARWRASRRHTIHLARPPTAGAMGVQSPAATLCTVSPLALPPSQSRLAMTHPAYRVCSSRRPPHRGWREARELARCLHTDERNLDHVTPSMGEQSSSSPSSASSSSFSSSSTAGEVVKLWTQSLEAAEVPEALLSAEHIVAHVLGVPRSELQRDSISAMTLTEQQLEEVERLVTCRQARMPLQYILGEWDFHHLTLRMVPPVFIPRPETEQLVELAMTRLQGLEAPRVLEIGCGSGAISLALLHALPQVECVTVDQSKHAVELTEANASRLGLSERLTVVAGKVTVVARPTLPHSTYDLVVSNPPYVLRKDLMEVQPEIMMYEDLRALDGGKDGLEVIKAVLQHAHLLLPPGRTLLLEVDPCHPYLLPAWLEKEDLSLKLVQVHQDFNKKERFMEFIKTS